MKANQRVESLETLSKGARHKRVRRFGSSGRVFTHSFDNAAGWKTSDHSKTGIERGSESLAVAPRKTPIVRRSKNLPSRSSVSGWRLDSTQTTLLVIGSLAFLCVILVILVQNIHPAPDQLALQKDAAELASLETQSRKDDCQIEGQASPLVAASNAGTERIAVQPEEHSEFAAPKSALIANRMSSVGRKMDAGSGEKHERPFKRGLEGRPNNVRNLQSQRAIAPTLQPYKQQGLGSFFSSIGRALGLSTRRDPL